jgi:S1-C subfamily serine protease
LTNNHVVESADEIEVVLNDGRQAKAKIIGTDPDSDLALLKIDLDRLPVIVLGNSDTLQVGDQVLAIGNPFGVGQTVTGGIVSALGRNQLGINTFENFIQTDAAINPGNSGGALVDTQGQLLGINTAIYSRSGGSLGIGFAFGTKATQGVVIVGVLQNGPAAKSGIRPGDVILSVADRPVGNVSELLSSVASLKPGAPSKFKLIRRDKNVELEVTPGVRPKPQQTGR